MNQVTVTQNLNRYFQKDILNITVKIQFSLKFKLLPLKNDESYSEIEIMDIHKKQKLFERIV